MVICSQCGAENQDDLSSCRLCLSPLQDAASELPTAALTPEFVETMQVTSPVPSSSQILCEQCSAINEQSYKFCQECGVHLANAAMAAAEQPLSVPPSQAQTPPMPPSPMTEAPTPRLSRHPGYNDPYKPRPASDAALTCPGCDNDLPPGSAFCNRCGTRLSVDQTLVMPSPKPGPRFRLRVIVDGEESDEVYLVDGKTVIGRMKGDINFPYDDYMSSRHASVTRRGDGFILQDEASRNGTFIMLDGEVELKPGDVFMVGKQLFKFEADE